MPRRPSRPASVPREHGPKPGEETSPNTSGQAHGERKPTQRQRLVDAMIELSARAGFQSVSVAQVAAQAGVSTATFYEQFGDKEDCLLAAYRAVAKRVFGQMRPVAGDGDWSSAARVGLKRLLSALQSDPSAGRVLFVEGLAGGQRIRAERRRVLGEFERLIQEFLDSPPKDGNTLDIPATAVMGALRNSVSKHLRTHVEDRMGLLVDDGLAWLESYAIPAGEARWSTGPNALLPTARPTQGRGASVRTPSRLPRGRHRLPAGVVARSQRGRLLHATAEVMMVRGYANATVADIVAQAGVSRDVFYAHFADKQHAFLEAQQHPTQYILDACAAAYFSAREWPERLWRCLDALLGLIVADPAISHLRLVECYAVGPLAIRRAEEITRFFTFFLEEGYGYRRQANGLPHVYSEAIVGAIFEIIQRSVAHGEAAQLPRRIPQIVYIAIAPFAGHEETIRLLEQFSAAELERSRSPAAPAAHTPPTRASLSTTAGSPRGAAGR
jgi:AcrR family transcriptional regulator